MVKQHDYAETPEQWLAHIAKVRQERDIALLKSAISICEVTDATLLKKGLAIADILLSMDLDTESLAVAIVYPLYQQHEIRHDIIVEKFGLSASKLLSNLLHMQSLGKLQQQTSRGQIQTENLRKMLLAMVVDVRAVLIILAERLWQLRDAKNSTHEDQVKMAQETFNIYAPLANRLGVWQLKWEIEDLCLRYLEPEIYKKIAVSLASRREEREKYIQRVIKVLSTLLTQLHIKNFEVTGRVKHIYSIYAKMKRKNADFKEIYDISAFRILVPEIPDCYTVLSVLQNTWSQILEEFDDYISQPKPNGYRSIHTVLVGPEDKIIEIQIRTHQMHQESELGVASHWRYKEGILGMSGFEAKIALLRQVMAWQKEIANPDKSKSDIPVKDLFADCIYVFTPLGDIIELPKGSTPIDFAYHIHSEIGHRCRGAKVDKKMVPLTHQLQTGNRIEIITAKESSPSRDWLNPHLGFVKSSRARSHIQHWFRVKDNELNLAEEREAEEKSAKRGKPGEKAVAKPDTIKPGFKAQVLGVDNLLSKIARCCKPLPGDAMIGYITANRGLSIHRTDCSNIAHLKEINQQRFIAVNIGQAFSGSYPVDLELRTQNRPGLLRDITTKLAAENIHVNGLKTNAHTESLEAIISLSISISNIVDLNRAISLLNKLPDVIEVRQTRVKSIK